MLRYAKKVIYVGFLLCPLLFSGCSFPNLNVLNFVKSKINSSASVHCNYHDEDGKNINAYFKDNWFKIEGGSVYDNLPGTIVSKDDKIWIWATESTEGYVLDLTVDYSGLTIPKKKIIINSKDIIEKIELQKQNCNPGLLDNSVFDIPGEITFTDYEEYLQK